MFFIRYGFIYIVNDFLVISLQIILFEIRVIKRYIQLCQVVVSLDPLIILN